MDKISIKFDRKTNYWKIPFLVIFSIGLIGFIVTSISDYDNRFTGFTGKLMKYYWIRQFGSLYYSLGTNQLTTLVPVTIMIMVESLYKEKKVKKYWTIYLIYACFCIGWIYIHSAELASVMTSDGSWGFGIEVDVMVDRMSRFWGLMIIVIINTAIVIFMMVYVNVYLRKKDYFLTDKYWLKAIKVDAFVLSGYLVLIILKQSTGRPEYFLTSFEDLVGKITYDSSGKAIDINLTQYILDIHGINDFAQLKANIINEINNGQWKPVKYLAWYQINGNWFENLKYWYPWNLITNPDTSQRPDGWQIINFPSGHTLATFTLIGYGSLFLFDNPRIKYCWKVLFVCVWITHVAMMNIMLCVTMVHYWSDVFFTDAFAPVVGVLTYHGVDKINNRIMKKRLNKKTQVAA